MTGIEQDTTEHDGRELLPHQKGEAVVKNRDIKETAMGIALEFFDYPLLSRTGIDDFLTAKDDFFAKRDLIAFGIKLLLKRSKIPCEEKGLFTETE